MKATDWLQTLNPEQREAVEHLEGPILVLAGAGSGKTRVLTTRIAHLTQEHGVDPAMILAVTFTNKAAAEMRQRIRRLLGGDPAGMWIGTFHSIGARLLRRHAMLLGWTPGFSIFDADGAQREVKRVMESLNISLKRWNPKAVHGTISAAKNQLVLPEEYAGLAGDPFTELVARVYPAYQKSLKEQNAFDFDDLLVTPVELFRQRPRVLQQYRERFGFVLVDEYQDTNRAQYRFLHMLAARAADQSADRDDDVADDLGGNLMVVGDDDQSIYGWRGADIRNILDFEKDFPGARIVRLETNYRSTARILDAANHVIAQNQRRKGKTLRTDAAGGEQLTRVEAWDERDEAEWIVGEVLHRLEEDAARTARDFVVLYRTNAQSRALEEAFRRHDLPYQIIGGTRFYERREIMDVLAYLRLLSNPRDAAAFDRIVNYPRRGIGDTSKAALYTWALEKGIPPLEAAARAEEVPNLRGPGAGALRGFAERMQRFTGLAAHLGVGVLLEQLVEEVGLIAALQEEGPEGEDRIDNVRELIAGAHDFDAMPEDAEDEDAPEGGTAVDLFLQKVSLLTDVDRRDPDANAVTLMTMHNAKGLEYPFVFISGLEEGLFPLARSFDERDALEEERRLFYVGITRARRKLYMTHVRMRRRAGEVMPCIPSSFMEPIPRELVEVRQTREVERMRSDFGYPRRRRTEQSWTRRAPSFDGSDDGVYIDYTDAQDTPRFVKGERVRHPQFGRGVIRELTGFGQDVKAVIEFEGAGRKKVILRYANLQKEL
jgi:DNA helicase II / ATP-dependent DNA helicase PcrA